MNVVEISNRFPTELEAVEYFELHRWKENTPHCPYCDSTNLSKRTRDYRLKCYDCNRTTSVTVNTFLHDTRLPLKTWLFAFSIITDAKKGVSALQLKRNLDISYPTAFRMYHKIRDMMSLENDTIGELDGVVEMDETFIGGKPRPGANKKCLPEKKQEYLDKRLKDLKGKGFKIKKGTRKVACDENPKRGRGTDNIKVAGIVERDGNVIAEVIKNVSYENIKKMVEKYVDEDNAVLITDELPAYNKISRIIEHVKIDHQKMYSYRGLNTNSIESFWAIIKRQIIGQHHQVSPKHLPKYIAEVVFKYNNRKVDDMFVTLVKKSMLTVDEIAALAN